ncbi:MAG: acyltransferase [Flavobacteriales bacterium]
MGYFKHETAIVDSGVHIGAGTKVWHFSHIMSGATLGTHCNLGQNVFIAAGVKIGSNVKIQNNVSVYSGVNLEDDVFLGPSMVFTNVNTPRSFVERKDYAETNVGKGASIGANATVVCGNNIGVYAFIGAGAVVTSPVPAYALMYGVPAKQHGWVSRNGMKLKLDENGCGICTETQEKYQQRGDELYLIEGE